MSLLILTSLSTSHQVSLAFDDGDGILLDRCGSSITAQCDIPHYNLSHVHILELKNDTAVFTIFLYFEFEYQLYKSTKSTYAFNVGWGVGSRGLYRDIIVLLKIDPSVASREKFTKK